MTAPETTLKCSCGDGKYWRENNFTLYTDATADDAEQTVCNP